MLHHGNSKSSGQRLLVCPLVSAAAMFGMGYPIGGRMPTNINFTKLSFLIYKMGPAKPGMVAQVFNPSVWKAEAGRSLLV